MIQIYTQFWIFRKGSEFLHYISWMIFQENYFSYYILLTDQISLSDYLYFWEILGNMYIVIICFPVYDIINLEMTLTFLSSRLPTWWPNQSGQKFTYFKNEKPFKQSLWFLDGFQLQNLSQIGSGDLSSLNFEVHKFRLKHFLKI